MTVGFAALYPPYLLSPVYRGAEALIENSVGW